MSFSYLCLLLAPFLQGLDPEKVKEIYLVWSTVNVITKETQKKKDALEEDEMKTLNS